MSLRASQTAETSQLEQIFKAARTLEESGMYEQARAALAPMWRGVGHRPAVRGLDRRAKGELLLRAGALTGWIGLYSRIEGAQEQAKDLISEAVRVFEELGDAEKVAEGRSELGFCYWRKGEYQEARALLEEAERASADEDTKAVASIRLAIVDGSESKYEQAIERMKGIAAAVGRSASSSVKGRFHVNLANLLLNHGTETKDEALTDRALVEYEGARVYFEEIGHKFFLAAVENQLGYLFFTKRRFAQAHEHLSKARKLYARLRDGVHTADVDETQARAYLEEGENGRAELSAGAAVKELKKGEAHGKLAEALITLGTAQARNGRTQLSQASYRRAFEVAEGVRAMETAGRACVTALEELAGRLTREEAAEFYERADEHISPAEHPELCGRLRAVARRLIRSGEAAGAASGGAVECGGVQLPGESPVWEGFNLKEQLRLFERVWIIAALRDGEGVPTRAARLLGFRNHESLIGRINSKHKDLATERTAVKRRRVRRVRRSGGAGLSPTRTV